MWFYFAVPGIGLAIVGLTHKRVAYVTFSIGAAVSAWLAYVALEEAFIKSALGPPLANTSVSAFWIANSIAATFCPVILTGLVALWQIKKVSDQRKLAQQYKAL